MRLGVDWGTNTLWVHADGKTHLLFHANCIREFRLREEEKTVKMKRPGSTVGTIDAKTKVYVLEAVMSNDQPALVRGLPELKKGKAGELLGAARDLLSRA